MANIKTKNRQTSTNRILKSEPMIEKLKQQTIHSSLLLLLATSIPVLKSVLL